MGPRHLDAPHRPRARPQEGRAEVQSPRREARRQVGPRQDQGRRPQSLAPPQGQGRALTADGRARHRERASGERPLGARAGRGGRARPPLALEGGPNGEVDPGGRPRARGRGSASPTSKALFLGRCPSPQPLALAMVIEAAAATVVHEIKHDGYRIVAGSKRRSAARLLQREGLDEGVPAGRPRRGRLPRGNGAPRRRGRRGAAERGDELPGPPAPRRRQRAAVYFAFDLLHLDGWDLRGAARAQGATATLESAPRLALQRSRAGPGAAFFGKRAAGLEGAPSSGPPLASRGAGRLAKAVPTEPGSRDRRLDAPRTGGAIGALVGHEDGQLVYAGKVGSGFATASTTCSAGWSPGRGTPAPSPPCPPT